MSSFSVRQGSDRSAQSCQTQTVYVVDDDVAVRRSLQFLLSTAGFTSWPFSCAFDFLDNLPNLRPAPILLDINMPEIDGMDLLSELANREITWPVIAMTGHANIPVAVQAIKNGAVDLLEKPLDFAVLEAALRDAVKRLSSIEDSAETRRNARRLLERLSSRETEILAILIDGLPNKVAAHHLSLSVRTIEMHRANALQKLKVKSIAEILHIEKSAEYKLKTLVDRNRTGCLVSNT